MPPPPDLISKAVMKAMALPGVRSLKDSSPPLEEIELPVPQPRGDEILIRVTACGVCRTDLDEIEGRTMAAFFPIIPGHQVTGIVFALGKKATQHEIGTRVGVGWIASACGTCGYCRGGRENLCADFFATGRDRHGGYAAYMLAREGFAVALPSSLRDEAAAPYLCAGAVGLQALRRCRLADNEALGFSGFGSSAHLILQAAKHLYPKVETFVFARSLRQREFALRLGATWAGSLSEQSPRPLDAVIDTTPVWEPFVRLAPQLKPGGRFVINAIRKENGDASLLAGIDFERHLWPEKVLTTVANVTRRDIEQSLELAVSHPLHSEISVYPLTRANQALLELHQGNQLGAKILVP